MQRGGIVLTLLTFVVGFLIAAATIVATAPTDRPQGWTSPIVLALLAAAALCALVTFGLLGLFTKAWSAFTRAWSSLRATAGVVGWYLPRIRVSWQAPERSLWRRAAARKRDERLWVTSATYGVAGKEVDVTEALNALVSEGRLTVSVDNTTMGSDPAPGVQKVLTVEFIAEGKTFTNTFAEGSRVVLP